MKAKLFTLLMMLFVFAGSAKANGSITSLKMAFHVDGTFWGPLTFPDTGAEEVIIDDPVYSLKLEWGQVFGELDQMKSIVLLYAVVDANNQPSLSRWKPMYFYIQADGSCITAFPQELIEEQWLSSLDTKTLVFYVQAVDNSSNLFLYDNGGEYYKITFKVGNRIRFNEQRPADLILDYYANGEERQITSIHFNADGSYSPTDDLGSLSNLFLTYSNVYFDHAEEIKQDDIEASLFYKVYEKGHGNEVDWTQIGLNVVTYLDYGALYAVSPDLDLTEGMEVGKDYVLEVYYQVSAGKESHTLGKTGTEGTMFRFTLVEKVAPPVEEEPLKYVMMAYSWNDNDIEFPTILAKGYPETVIQEPVYSFKIHGLEALTEERIQNVELFMKINDPGSPAGSEWYVYHLTDYGFGMWSWELPNARELMLDRWQEDHETICVEFYLRAEDQDGKFYYFDNGEENYKITFTCGEDTRPKGIKDFTLTIDVNGEVLPVPVPDTGAYEVKVPFPLSSFKIVKAEIKTGRPMKYVRLYSTLYDTADGPSYDEDAWEMNNFVNQSDDTWVLDFQGGKELIEEEWVGQSQSKTKTFQFFAIAEDTDGEGYVYNNDNEFYKYTFTTDNADGIKSIDNGKLTIDNGGEIYNLAGQRLQKMQKGINIIGGKKILVK